MADSIFDYPNSVNDIMGYDLDNPARGETKRRFVREGQTPNEDVYRSIFGRPTSPLFNAERNRSRSTPANFQTSPSSGLYADATAPFVEGSGMLPKPLADEVSRYNRRTPVDLIANALAQSFGFPADIATLIGSENPKYRADISPYKGLDRDEYPAGSMRNPSAATPVSTDPNRITPRRSTYQPNEADEIARRQAELGVMPTGRLPSEPAPLTTEHLKGLLREYGITSDNDLPIAQFIADFVAPYGGVKGMQAGMRKINEVVPNMRRASTPVTATLEGVAPDLGQRGDDAFKELITDRLIGGKGSAIDTRNFAGQPSTTSRGYGAWKKETNPLVGVDVPNISDISQSPEFIRAMNQTGSSLNQEGMAAHRFLPQPFNTRGDASSMMIKPQFGDLTKEQFLKLNELLGGSMAFTHNPRLGGAVAFPFDEVTAANRGDTTELFKKAMDKANQVLGGNAQTRFGKSDYAKDRFYAEAPYAGYSPAPDVSDIRDILMRIEDNKFPK
jgi:hypothetical protein